MVFLEVVCAASLYFAASLWEQTEKTLEENDLKSKVDDGARPGSASVDSFLETIQENVDEESSHEGSSKGEGGSNSSISTKSYLPSSSVKSQADCSLPSAIYDLKKGNSVASLLVEEEHEGDDGDDEPSENVGRDVEKNEGVANEIESQPQVEEQQKHEETRKEGAEDPKLGSEQAQESEQQQEHAPETHQKDVPSEAQQEVEVASETYPQQAEPDMSVSLEQNDDGDDFSEVTETTEMTELTPVKQNYQGGTLLSISVKENQPSHPAEVSPSPSKSGRKRLKPSIKRRVQKNKLRKARKEAAAAQD